MNDTDLSQISAVKRRFLYWSTVIFNEMTARRHVFEIDIFEILIIFDSFHLVVSCFWWQIIFSLSSKNCCLTSCISTAYSSNAFLLKNGNWSGVYLLSFSSQKWSQVLMMLFFHLQFQSTDFKFSSKHL